MYLISLSTKRKSLTLDIKKTMITIKKKNRNSANHIIDIVKSKYDNYIYLYDKGFCKVTIYIIINIR